MKFKFYPSSHWIKFKFYQPNLDNQSKIIFNLNLIGIPYSHSNVIHTYIHICVCVCVCVCLCVCVCISNSTLAFITVLFIFHFYIYHIEPKSPPWKERCFLIHVIDSEPSMNELSKQINTKPPFSLDRSICFILPLNFYSSYSLHLKCPFIPCF